MIFRHLNASCARRDVNHVWQLRPRTEHVQEEPIVHVSWKRSVRTTQAPETCPCSAVCASLPRQSSPVDDTHAVAARSKRESEHGLHHSVRPILLVSGKPLCARTRSRANANVRPRSFVSKQTARRKSVGLALITRVGEECMCSRSVRDSK